jgi:TetR/AcrR family transcriptional repressor of nem operon
MRYPAHETAEKHRQILASASQLFRQRGFLDVSVAEIMKAIGLTHGPFYNHFASKQDLAAKSVAAESERALGELRNCAPTTEGRSAYVNGYLSTAHCEAPGTGCLIATLAADVAREPEAKAVFTTHMQTLIARFAAQFPWRSGRAARGEAIHTLAAMVGGVVLARASADPEFAEEILAEVRKHVAETQAG